MLSEAVARAHAGVSCNLARSALIDVGGKRIAATELLVLSHDGDRHFLDDVVIKVKGIVHQVRVLVRCLKLVLGLIELV